jgi:hypothetical protein
MLLVLGVYHIGWISRLCAGWKWPGPLPKQAQLDAPAEFQVLHEAFVVRHAHSLPDAGHLP